jgi:hypothetical protein
MMNTTPSTQHFSRFNPIKPRETKTAFQKLTNHLSLPSAFAVTGEKQLHLIYPGIIIWRVIAANNRRMDSPNKSWNEIRETLIRDPIGMAFWMLTCPIVQRAYIANQSAVVKDSLLSAREIPQTGIRSFLAKINPIEKYGLPSNQQVQDYKTLGLDSLKASGVKVESKAYKTLESFYTHLENKRNTASLISLGLSILALGVAINLLNFYLTRKNVENRKQDASISPKPVTHPQQFTAQTFPVKSFDVSQAR